MTLVCILLPTGAARRAGGRFRQEPLPGHLLQRRVGEDNKAQRGQNTSEKIFFIYIESRSQLRPERMLTESCKNVDSWHQLTYNFPARPPAACNLRSHFSQSF